MDNDLRQQFPPPPCVNCGKGICVQSMDHAGYFCPLCQRNYYVGGIDAQLPESLKSLAPLVLHIGMSTNHWFHAIGHAFDKADPDKAIKSVETYKKWLDEVVTPMVDKLRQTIGEETTNPIPENTEIPDTVPKKGEL